MIRLECYAINLQFCFIINDYWLMGIQQFKLMIVGPLRVKHLQELDPSDQIENSVITQFDEQVQMINYREKLTIFLNLQIYNLLMAILTIYSIFAIDIQKSFFNQQQAFVFGYIHIFSICIFSTEMVLNWLGKKGYSLSFYFWIDIISTMSMVLQITWIDNFLADNSNLPGVLTIAKVIKASRLSKIGGRAAKIILLFLNYLKNKKAEEQKRIRQTKNTESVLNQSVFKTQTVIDNKLKSQIQNQEEISNMQLFNSEPPKKIQLQKSRLDVISEQKSQGDDQNKLKQFNLKFMKPKDSVIGNSLLGKRRSKNIRISEGNMALKRSQKKVYQISNIVQRLQQTFKLQPLARIKVAEQKQIQMQKKWQQVCAKQQQLRKQARQQINSNKQNFKLGQTLKQKIQKNIIIMIMSLIIILPLLSAETWFNKDPSIDIMMNNYFLVAENITDKVLLQYYLSSLIQSSFDGTSPIVYLKVQTIFGNYIYPNNFPDLPGPQTNLEDMIEAQKNIVSGSSYELVFSARSVSQLTAKINVVRSIFITILLIFSTIIFMYSIEANALAPLQKMCISINKISINPFDALRQLNEKKDQKQNIEKTVTNEQNNDQNQLDRNDLQTNILERAIWKMTNLLVIGAGQIGTQLISARSDNLNSASYLLESTQIHGVFLYMHIANYQKICESLSQGLLNFINKFANSIHQIVVNNGGVLLQNQSEGFLTYWATPQDMHIELQTSKYFTTGNPLKNLGKTVETQRIIQLALRSYLQICISLSECSKKRIEDPQRQKDYQQFESFALEAGFHLGDGFKGSVGSPFKIQVKCLGGDVEYTKKLSRLAGKYRLSNLVSNQLCQIIDDLEGNCIRKMDYIRQKLSGDVYWLYSYDFTLLPLTEPQKTMKLKRKRRTKKKTTKAVKEKQKQFSKKQRGELLAQLKIQSLENVMPFSQQQKMCQKMFNIDFYQTWNYTLGRYYANQWQQAASLFENVNDYYSFGYKDIMSSIMRDRIRQSGGYAPNNWDKCFIIDTE